jgi:hypothetical protein
MTTDKRPTSAETNDLDREARLPAPSFLREVWDSLMYSGKWWLIPVVVCIVILGMLVMLSGTAAAPFIYTLF